MWKKTNPFKRSAAAALAIILLLLAACSDNGGGTAGGASSSGAGGKEQTLVIAMTATNIPVPDTYPTEGYEGFRFVGYQLYDGLVNWDLSQGEKPAGLKPGLAESWVVSEDRLSWTFRLRQGVTFHDGTPFDADAVIFNFDRIMKTDFEYFNVQVAGSVSSYTKHIASYAKIDDAAVEITTKTPYSFLPYALAHMLIASPEEVRKNGDAYVNHPVGTGPFKFVRMSQGQELVMAKNDQYWGGAPKIDKVILRPISDPSARLAALQAGEVNWAEVPPTESIDLLKNGGFQVLTNLYPHIWPYVLNTSDGPWKEKKVRQAANYAIDRQGMSDILLNGAAKPAWGYMYEGHSWYSDDGLYTYDPERAKRLLAEAGYPDGFQTTFLVPSSGSGNMWPVQMNEFIQQNLKAVGIDVKIETIEWQALINQYIAGFPTDRELGAINISLAPVSPNTFDSFITAAIPPRGWNVSEYSNPEVDKLFELASTTFDEAESDKYLSQITAIINEDAPWIYVVHDLNLRALAPNIKGFIQPQSWFADLTTISIE